MTQAPGTITLARHGEPALSRKVRLTAAEYRDWWARYEIGGLKDGQIPPGDLVATANGAGAIISSTRRRAIETAEALVDGRGFARQETLIEAPLPPPDFPDWFRLSPRHWGFVARVCWWFFNYHGGQETRAEAEARSDKVALELVNMASTGQGVLVVAHGFFNTMVGRSLKRLGWRCTSDGGYRYWAARRFERAG